MVIEVDPRWFNTSIPEGGGFHGWGRLVGFSCFDAELGRDEYCPDLPCNLQKVKRNMKIVRFLAYISCCFMEKERPTVKSHEVKNEIER